MRLLTIKLKKSQQKENNQKTYQVNSEINYIPLKV